jgi:transcriptional regulator GlxA family with amidase domain
VVSLFCIAAPTKKVKRFLASCGNRAYACIEMGVLDIAQHLNVSRRYLEQQFRKALGHSIFSEIQRVRLETAQRLLGETDWKLETVAGRSGFKQAARMSAVFQQKLGLHPGQYRRIMQNPS